MSGGLTGCRVLEIGETVAAAQAGKIFADIGADVVKVELPGGDPLRGRGPFPGDLPHPEKSGLFLALNTNKRSIVLDDASAGDDLARLARSVDVLFHDFPAKRLVERGVDVDRLRRENPALVVCSITPFGLSGPHRDYQATELTITHGGGWGWLSPGASDRPDLPPLKAAGPQAELQGGLAGALAAMASYFRARTSGVGEHVDLSMQAFVASFLEMNFVHYTYAGRVASRLGRRMLYPWGIFRCADGPIFLVVVEPDQWKRLKELMGSPEWAEMEIFADPYKCGENWDAMKPFLEEWTATWKVEDLWRAGQEKRICFAPTLSMADLATQPQLREREMFVETTHPDAGTLTMLGAPYRLAEPWWAIRRPAPRLGEHTREVLGEIAGAEAKRAPKAKGREPLPLDGVRVVDFSWAWAGPFCAMHLAHLGAEVIRVESEAHLDLGRRIPIFPIGMEPGPNRSGYFNQWGQGKKSIQVALRHPQGLEVVKRLIAKSDVVVDNYATGVMNRLGLGYEELRRLKPDIIAASISGYGHTGPQKNYMNYGPAVVQLAGLASITGYRGGGPQEVGISYGDPNGGIHGALAIVAALVSRQKTGRGQEIDVSLWDANATLVMEGWMEHVMNGREPERLGNRDRHMAPHECFRCKGEDEWVTIACRDDAEWRALATAIGRTELGSDARFATLAARKENEDALEEILTAWTAERDKWKVTRALQKAGVAAFPSMNSKELREDAHLVERGFFAELEHPEVGVRTHTGIPWILAERSNGVRSPAPVLGADTDEVLETILGYSKAEIEALRAADALR